MWFDVLYARSVVGVCARVNVCFTRTWLAIYVKWAQMCHRGVSVSACILPLRSAPSLCSCVSVCVCVFSVGLTSAGAVGLCTLVREWGKEKERVRKQERQSGGSLGVNGATWLRPVVGQPVVLFLSLSPSAFPSIPPSPLLAPAYSAPALCRCENV